MQNFHIIVYIVSLAIQIFLLVSHINCNDLNDKQKQNAKDSKAKEHLDSLQKMVNSTEDLKTGYWMKYGVQRDLSEQKTLSFTSDLERQYYLYETINSRMTDMQCTYAQHAQKHLTLLWSVVEHNLLSENISKILLAHQSLYVEVAKKTIATFCNQKYEPSKWMYDLLDFLQMKMKIFNVTVYISKLSGMLVTLKNVNGSSPCNKIPLVKWDYIIEEYPSSFLENVNNLVTMKQKIETDSVQSWIDKNKVNTIIIETYSSEKQVYKPDNDSTNKNNKKFSVRVCDTFLFYHFQDITVRIIENILNILYILLMNENVLPYENYETIFKKTLEKIPITKYNDENVDEESDFYKEFSEVDLLHDNVIEMINNSIWRSEKTEEYVKKTKNQDVSEMTNDKKFDYKNYYRSEFATQMTVKNSLIYDLNCTYVFYAREHLNGITFLLENKLQIKDNNFWQDNIVVLTNYFEVSLMTLATVYSSGYQAPDWMWRLVLYLSKIHELCLNLDSLKTVNDQILRLLNDGVTSCDIADDPPMKLTIPQEMIQTTIEKSTIFKNIILLDLDDKFHNNIKYMFYNAMEINYFLNINKNLLLYTNFEQFNPSKWILKATALTEDKRNNLRWDTNILLGKDDRWDESTAVIFGNLNDKYESNDELGNAVSIHNSILDFVRVALFRYLILLGGYCNTIKNAQNSLSKAYYTKGSNTMFINEYTQRCSNKYKPIGDLLEWSGLKTDRVIIDLLEALDILQFNEDIFQKKGFRAAVKKLNQLSINLGINAHFSLIYNWVKFTLKVQEIIKQPVEKVTNDNIINLLKNEVQTINDAITNYTKTFKDDYKEINFNTLSLI